MRTRHPNPGRSAGRLLAPLALWAGLWPVGCAGGVAGAAGAHGAGGVVPGDAASLPVVARGGEGADPAVVQGADPAPGGFADSAPGTLPGARSGLAALDHAARSALVDFARRLADDVSADSVGSLAAAVVKEGEVVWEGAFGVAVRADSASRTDSAMATPVTIYRVGSITKTVTALVLLRLVEEGVLGLDDAVSDHVPEIARLAGRQAGGRAITFRDLASHTAGLAREPASTVAARGRLSHWDRKVVSSIPLTEVPHAPGETYRYSNIGYGILGLALERAADRPFEDLVAEHVLEPLGMTNSFFSVPRRDRSRLAAGYVNPDDGAIDPRVPRAEHRGRGYKLPNGGLYSTVGDLTRLAMALSGHPDHALLSDASRSAMLRDHTPDPDPRSGYGLGVQLTRLGGALLVGHSGSVAGYTAYLATDPATATAVVMLRNYNRGRTNLAAEAQRLLLTLSDGTP